MKNFDCIIFDVDGTLTSTNELIFASFRYIAKKYLNIDKTDEEIISMFGPPEDVILKEWCGKDFAEGRKAYYKFYADNHNMAGLYPGMKELITFLKSKDILVAIFTGKGRDATIISMEKLEVLQYFDYIVTGDDVLKYKPSSEGIIKILENLKLDKDRVLMVGDSTVDILAAREAGVVMASVVWDSYGINEVLKMNNDCIFHTVEDLKTFLTQNV